ncbi:DciA family protein [Psychromonas sp.]|nr:DciA family protein [Psychromonas sp.]
MFRFLPIINNRYTHKPNSLLMAVMTTHKKQPKSIALLLNKNHFQQSTSLITKLDIVLQRLLKQHNISGCRIGNVENGILLIESSTSIWLQRLQFIRSEILTELRQHHSSLMNIKIKVNPELAKVTPSKLIKNKPAPKRAQKMSKDIADSFLALAENADPKLKKSTTIVSQILNR